MVLRALGLLVLLAAVLMPAPTRAAIPSEATAAAAFARGTTTTAATPPSGAKRTALSIRPPCLAMIRLASRSNASKAAS